MMDPGIECCQGGDLGTWTSAPIHNVPGQCHYENFCSPCGRMPDNPEHGPWFAGPNNYCGGTGVQTYQCESNLHEVCCGCTTSAECAQGQYCYGYGYWWAGNWGFNGCGHCSPSGGYNPGPVLNPPDQGYEHQDTDYMPRRAGGRIRRKRKSRRR